MGDDRPTVSNDERQRILTARTDAIMALPPLTLVCIGLRPPSGNVQGSISFRIGDGLGPTGRDMTARDRLRHECDGWYVHAWPWGYDVLATPLPEPERATPPGTMADARG